MIVEDFDFIYEEYDDEFEFVRFTFTYDDISFDKMFKDDVFDELPVHFFKKEKVGFIPILGHLNQDVWITKKEFIETLTKESIVELCKILVKL